MTSTLQLEPAPQSPDAAPPSPPAPPSPDDHAPGRRRGVALAVALVAAGAAGGGLAAHELLPTDSSAATSTAGTQVVPNAASIAAQVSPAIVDINTTIGYQNAQAAGTGMVLTSTGEVLTNNHVISGATSITATDVGNGKTYQAVVVGYDKTDDVAVLQLQGATGLTTIRPASNTVQVGDAVVGIGNAGGTGGTPGYAAGVITATGQTITASDSSDGTSEQLTGLLQTDANIVAGDSGGPLVNINGQVVGMDTAASSGFRFSQSSQGFAIPIGNALQIAQQIEGGRPGSTIHIGATAMLGVGVQPDATGGFSAGPAGNGQGAVVAQVVSGGPAATAGIAVGDTITGVAGRAITSASDLSRVMLQQQPGRTVSLSYVDSSGTVRSTTVRLASGPPQ